MDKTARQTLIDIARHSIEHGLVHGVPMPVDSGAYQGVLSVKGACFVTLLLAKQLRGCIGSLEARRPLVEDCAENAFAAAFRDPRFAPITVDEFRRVELHISVLSVPQPFAVSSEQDLLARLEPNRDGLILCEGRHRATFLPSVWSQLPDPAAFVSQLKRKAGLSTSYWSDSIRFERYTVENISES